MAEILPLVGQTVIIDESVKGVLPLLDLNAISGPKGGE